MRPPFVITVLLVLLTQTSIGQITQPTKKQVSSFFRSSIKQESKKRVQIGSGAWNACNLDSAFFKSDTITFQNAPLSSCCQWVQWTFYRKNAFVQTTAQTCKEPSSGTVAKANDFYTVDLSGKGMTLVLETRSHLGHHINYRVVGIDKRRKTLTLVRIPEMSL